MKNAKLNAGFTAQQTQAVKAHTAKQDAQLDAARKAYPKLRHFFRNGMLNSR